MPKRRAPKKINREIIKAIKYLTNESPKRTIKLASIVSRVKLKLGEIRYNENFKDIIRGAVYELRDIGFIDQVGYNQFTCPEFLIDSEMDEPETQPGKPESKYFIPYTRKTTLENTNSLDPNRKRRHLESESRSSLSGSEFERTRKRFYGKKMIKKDEFNPPLPGARQVPKEKKFVEKKIKDDSINNEVQIEDTPRCSYREKRPLQVTAMPKRYCNVVQLIKSDDEVIRTPDFIATEEQSSEKIKFDSDVVEDNSDVE